MVECKLKMAFRGHTEPLKEGSLHLRTFEKA